jgi:molybdate transport system permease protein
VSSDSPLALSLQIATIATILAAAAGIAFGTLLAQNRFRGRNLADALVTAPMVLPPTVLGYYLLVVLGRHSPIGHAYEALTGSSIVFTKTGAVVAAAFGAFPIMVKSSRAALEDVDPVFVRAARTLGAGPARAFFTVQLPLATRGILAAVMLSFARSLGDFGVTLMVAGDIPHETQTASLAIYDAIQSHREDEAVQMVVLLSVIAITILYLVNRLTAKRDATR